MSNIITHGDIAFGLGSQTAFSFGTSPAQHTTIKPEEKDSKPFVPWGDDNQYPQNFKEALRKNGAGGAGLRVVKSTHYGQGFQLFIENVDENGNINNKMVSLNSKPDIKKFFKQCKMNRFWTETIADLETYYIAFPEFILSKDFNKIVSVRRKQAAKMRYEKINPATGLIENAYFCHNWTSSTTVDSEYVSKIPVIDSYWNAEQIKEYCKKKKIYKFILPIFYPLLDETYYPQADWHAVYINGWFDVANSIPAFKKALFKNQLNIKHIVHISEEYFVRTYKEDWQKFDTNKRKTIRDELTQKIDEHLSGNENAGKSIQSVTYKDINGDWVKGIEVESVDNKLKDGSYLPEASAANSEIMFALGVDPSLLGAGIPGGKMNTGSGSDKREAFSILTSLFKTKREISLEPWQLLRDYNGWDENLEANFTNTELTTLDVDATGTQITI